jgi:hypothetical protein
MRNQHFLYSVNYPYSDDSDHWDGISKGSGALTAYPSKYFGSGCGMGARDEGMNLKDRKMPNPPFLNLVSACVGRKVPLSISHLRAIQLGDFFLRKRF